MPTKQYKIIVINVTNPHRFQVLGEINFEKGGDNEDEPLALNNKIEELIATQGEKSE